MLKKENFTSEHIQKVRERTKTDPTIIERAIFAFGLLEALVRTGAEFVFKGGSSLMLLLDKPMRLSTDIDIIVARDYEIEPFIDEAAKIYPFVSKEEIVRRGANKIVKKHYKFYYSSLSTPDRTVPILLDVLFEENHYATIIQKEIKTGFLEVEGAPTYVSIPSVNSLLGDKLTAFAPNTSGIRYTTQKGDDIVVDKKTEVIKQFFDIASLFDKADDFMAIKNSYIATVQAEIAYRDVDLTYKDCLQDSFNCALGIFSRGKLFPNEYANLLDGIKRIRSFLMNVRFDGETAYTQAAKVMLLCAGIMTDTDILKEVPTINEKLEAPYNKINFMQKIDEPAFNMARYAIYLTKKIIF